MIYKAIMMSKKEIVIGDAEDLKKFLDAANGGARLVLTKFGVINPSSIDSIVVAKDKMEDVRFLLLQGKYTERTATEKVLGFSPFSALIEKYKQLQQKN